MWYEFLVLPFGLATAPFVFTKLTYPVVAFLRAFGIRLIIFLDVMLVVGATEDECRDIVARVIQTLVDAGFRIYLKKSPGVPVPWPCPDLSNLPDFPVAQALPGSQLYGAAGPGGETPFLQRPLGQIPSRSLTAVPDLVRRPLPVSISREAHADLRWVAQLRRQDCAAPLWTPSLDQADLRVAAVASDEGRGVFCLGGWMGADGLRRMPLRSNVEEHSVLLIFLGVFFPAI